MLKRLRARLAAHDHAHVRRKDSGEPEGQAVCVVLLVLEAVDALEQDHNQAVAVDVLPALNNLPYLLVAHVQPERKVLPQVLVRQLNLALYVEKCLRSRNYPQLRQERVYQLVDVLLVVLPREVHQKQVRALRLTNVPSCFAFGGTG